VFAVPTELYSCDKYIDLRDGGDLSQQHRDILKVRKAKLTLLGQLCMGLNIDGQRYIFTFMFVFRGEPTSLVQLYTYKYSHRPRTGKLNNKCACNVSYLNPTKQNTSLLTP
jgi:hypothetical protein